MVFNLVIEPFTTFFCFFYSIQCIPTSLYSGKHVYKLTTTCAKAKNDVYLCARSFSLMTEKTPISIINPTAANKHKQKFVWIFFWMNDGGACVTPKIEKKSLLKISLNVVQPIMFWLHLGGGNLSSVMTFFEWSVFSVPATFSGYRNLPSFSN